MPSASPLHERLCNGHTDHHSASRREFPEPGTSKRTAAPSLFPGNVGYWGHDKVIKLENDYLAEEKNQEGKEAGHRTALLDGIRDKFGAVDRTKDFNETMGRLYIGLDEEAKSFFYWELLGFGLHDLKCELKELEDEYAGIEMDFSKYMARISALCQLKIIIRKLNPPEPAYEKDFEEEM